jgi:hypothetical protein
MRRLGLFFVANALATLWTLFAVTRPWVGTISDDPPRELVQRTLLLALVAAAAVTALVGAALPNARRNAFLRRHVVANLPDRRTAFTLAAVVLLPYFALLPYHNSTIPTASDEPHYLIIMQSLVLDHDLDLTNNYDSQAYRDR